MIQPESSLEALMPTRPPLRSPMVLAPCIAAALLTFAEPALAQPAAGAYAALVAERAQALVTVKLVLELKLGGELGASEGGEGQEMENEALCVLIDAGGTVLCSNTLFGGYAQLMDSMLPEGFEMTTEPKDLKVLVGGDGEELPATVVVRDSDRDLVWLRITAPPERRFPFLDFSQGVEPATGDVILALFRLDRYFERAPAVSEGKVGAIVRRPRRLLVPSTTLASGIGAPVFDALGRIVGLTVSQVPDDAAVSDNPLAMMSQTLRVQQGIQGLILPAAEIVAATRQALALDTPAAPPQP